jgi:hypothetical protein
MSNPTDSNQTFNSSALVNPSSLIEQAFKNIFKSQNLIIDQLPFKGLDFDNDKNIFKGIDCYNINFRYMLRNWRIPEEFVKRHILPVMIEQNSFELIRELLPENTYDKDRIEYLEEELWREIRWEKINANYWYNDDEHGENLEDIYEDLYGPLPDDSWQEDPYEMYQIV